MRYNPEKHNRSSIRLKGYNYGHPGDYFITICTKDRENLLGEIKDGEMILNEAGEIVEKCWLEIPKHFPNIELDIFQIMPNHIHGIIRIVENEDNRIETVGNSHDCSETGDDPNIRNSKNNRNNSDRNSNSNRNSHGCSLQGGLRQHQKLPVIMGSFKSSVARICNKQNLSMEWQKSYYDHIIRS